MEHADLKATGLGSYSYAGGITGIVFGSSITNCSVSDSVIESARDKITTVQVALPVIPLDVHLKAVRQKEIRSKLWRMAAVLSVK